MGHPVVTGYTLEACLHVVLGVGRAAAEEVAADSAGSQVEAWHAIARVDRLRGQDSRHELVHSLAAASTPE